MYVVLVNEDNTLTTTRRQRIMQKSKLVDDLCFLMYPIYNGHDMTEFTVVLEYVLPVSKEYCSEILELSEERYKNYLWYKLPVDTDLTNESGEIEIKLSFLSVELDGNNEVTQRVRKTDATTITIYPREAWSGMIPDEKLDAIDQRILMTDAQIKELREMGDMFDKTKADDLRYDDDTNEIQLLSDGKPIGTPVGLGTVQVDKDDIMEAVGETLSGGVPVVEFGSDD